jgi:hypothetical protein
LPAWFASMTQLPPAWSVTTDEDGQ